MAKKPKKPAGKKPLRAGETQPHQAEKAFGAYPPNFRGFTASFSKLGKILLFSASCVLIVVVVLSAANALVGSVLGVVLALALTSMMAYVPGILAKKFTNLPKQWFDWFLRVNIPLTSLLFGLIPFAGGIDLGSRGATVDWCTTVGLSLLLLGSVHTLILVTGTGARYYTKVELKRRAFYATWVVVIAVFILITGPWMDPLRVSAGILVLLVGMYGLFRLSVSLGFQSCASFDASKTILQIIGLGDLCLLLLMLVLKLFRDISFTMLAIAVVLTLMEAVVGGVARIKSLNRFFAYFTFFTLDYYAVTVCVYSILYTTSTPLGIIIPLICTSIVLYAPLAYAAKNQNLKHLHSIVQRVMLGNTALFATGILLLPTGVAIELATHQILVPLTGIIAITSFILVGITSFFYRRSGLQKSPSRRFYTWFKACAGTTALITSLFVLGTLVQSVSFLMQTSVISQVAFYVFGGAMLAPVAFPYSQLTKNMRQVFAIAISLGIAFSISIITYLVLTTYAPLATMLDVTLGISFDFGILLVFIVMSLFRGQLSTSIWNGARWAGVLLPVINFTIIYRLFSPIDVITTPLSLFGIVNVSGGWVVTVIASTLIYLPVVSMKSRKVHDVLLFVLWGETVVLLAWSSVNLFAGNLFNSWGFLAMTAIGLLMPLARKANAWKMLSVLLLAFGVVSAFFVPMFLFELGVSLPIGLTIALIIGGACILAYSFMPGRHPMKALRLSAYFIAVGGIFFLVFLSFLLIPTFEYFGVFTAVAIAIGLFFVARRRGLLKAISVRMLFVVMTGAIALSVSTLAFILWQANFIWLAFIFTTIMVAFLYRYLASSQVASRVLIPLPVTFFVQGLLSLYLPPIAVLVCAWIVTYLTAFLVQTNILQLLAKQRREAAQTNVLPQIPHTALTPDMQLTLWSMDALFVSLWIAISSEGTWTTQFLIFSIIFFVVSAIEFSIIKQKRQKIGHFLHALGSALMAIAVLAVVFESAPILGIHIWIILTGWFCGQLYSNRILFAMIRAFIDKKDHEKGAKAKSEPLFQTWERGLQALIVYATLLLLAEYILGLILPHVHLERIVIGVEVWSRLLAIASITHFFARLDQRAWKLFPSRNSALLILCTWLGVLVGLLPWEYVLVTIALPVLPLIVTLILAEVYSVVYIINSIREDKIRVEAFKRGFSLALEVNFSVWPLYFTLTNVNGIIPLIMVSALIFLGMTFIDERVAPANGQQVRLAVRRMSFLVFGGTLSIEIFLLLFNYSVDISVTVALLVFVGFCAVVVHPFRNHSPQAMIFWFAIWVLLAGIIYFLTSSLLASIILLLACGLMYVLIFFPSVRDRLRNFVKRVMDSLAHPFHQIITAIARWSKRVSVVMRNIAEKIAAYWRNHATSLWILFSILCGTGITYLMAVNGEILFMNSFAVGFAIFFMFLYGIFPLTHPAHESNKIASRKKAIYFGGLYWSFSWAILCFIPFDPFLLLGNILLFGGILLCIIHQKENRRIISFKWRFGVTFSYVVLICITIACILWVASGLVATLVFLTISFLGLVFFLAMVFKAPPPVIDSRFAPVTKESPHPPAIPNPDLLMQFFANPAHTVQLASLRKFFSQQQTTVQFLHGIVRALIILLLRHTRTFGKIIRNPTSITITIMAIFADIIGFHFDPKELGDFINQKIQVLRDDHLLGERKGKLFLTRRGMGFFKEHA